MGELVEELEELGYVERRPGPTDRRAKLIVLTPRGHECIDADIARDGTPISRNTFRTRVWLPAIKASGIGFDVRVHDLRHATPPGCSPAAPT